ncbi:MAG: threonine aldolase [Alphaproteobacteria bacterium]|nr:threonine aldolase [Alphaproteobacteria bacterium]
MDMLNRAAEIKRRCRRFVSHDRPARPAEALRELAAYAGDCEADKYNSGELVERLERRVAHLLGKEAVAYMPSGKLAQLAALRVLADRAGCRRVAMHPRSHFEEYELRAYQELWSMTAASFGGYDRLPTPVDLRGITEKLGALTLEMPLRRLGCVLQPWDELVEISQQARRRGIALHLDGARIWESQPHYGKPFAEIAALFDTVYVAFDKGLGGLAGAALAGSGPMIEEARVWQRRAGGRALRSFPYLLSALKGLDERLPRMADYHERAVAIAAALRTLPRVRVSPDPPHANAFHVIVEGACDRAREAALGISEETGVWLFDDPVDCPIQGLAMFEITVREAAFELTIDEIRDVVGRFVEALPSGSGAR